MRILIVHNRYQQPGGEDVVVKSEYDLLKRYGHEVVLYERNNGEFKQFSFFQKFWFIFDLFWSIKTYQELRSLIQRFKPDVAHFHNILFMITPSAYQACRDEGVPIVQTLHNFRLFCSNGLFYRDDMICEDCLGKRNPWTGIYHHCYKNSRMKTFLVSWLTYGHWRKRTWLDWVDMYIALTEFGKQKFIEGGIPPEKILVKPHFFEHQPISKKDGAYALYIGRLSPEKGIDILLEAWQSIDYLPLKIIGDGPLREGLKEFVKDRDLKNIEFLGHCSLEECHKYLEMAKIVVVPSRCYETFSRVTIEAFSYGIPVLASRLGSLREIVEEKQTGFLFNPEDSSDLAVKVKWFMDHPQESAQMGLRASQVYQEKYRPEQNGEQLTAIYKEVIDKVGYEISRR